MVVVLFDHRWEDKGVHTFTKGICPKVNIIAQLEFKLVYDSSMRTPPITLQIHPDLKKVEKTVLST